MRAEDWDRLSEIVGEAILLPPAERSTFLDAACAGDARMREEADRLIALDAEAGRFLESPVAAPLATEVGGAWLVGRSVGGFRVLRHIATGGMGAVYEAEQDAPRRRVALKVVRPSIDSPSLARRLAQEAEVLSRLRHPRIAQVFGAGRATIDGQEVSYLVMELVAGRPLDQALGRGAWSVAERVVLLADIAEAVQHAHERGVIHRDLKPSNVLVDEERSPRVLDFGIARLVEADPLRTMAPTAPGLMVGTLRYMSPEQMSGLAEAVDTRADVYALGVMAYELLSGRLPFDAPSGSIAAWVDLVARSDPPALRRVAPAIDRDLECIAMKAIEREPSRRYASARDLGLDLRRWLRGEAVEARPATRGYVLRTFARRHRGLVASLAAIVLVLAAATVLYANEARTARRAAEAATVAAGTSQAVSDFLARTLANIDPNRGTTVDIRDLVERTLAEVGPTLREQPLPAAAVHEEAGTIFYNLRLFAEAAREYAESLRLREPILGGGAEATLDSVNALGQSLAHLGRPDEAKRHYRRALEGRTLLLGPDHAKTLVVRNNLAVLLEGTGDRAGAETELRAVLAAQKRAVGPHAEATLITMGNLAALCRRAGRPDEALELREAAFEGFVALHGPDHAMTAMAENALAQSLHERGRFGESEPHFQSARDRFTAIRGPIHAEVALVENNWGAMLVDAGRFDDAIPHFTAALAIHEAVSGPDHRVTIGIVERRAAALRRADRLDAAAEAYSDLAARCARSLGDAHARTIDARLSAAEALQGTGNAVAVAAMVRSVQDSLEAHAELATPERRRRLAALLESDG